MPNTNPTIYRMFNVFGQLHFDDGRSCTVAHGAHIARDELLDGEAAKAVALEKIQQGYQQTYGVASSRWEDVRITEVPTDGIWIRVHNEEGDVQHWMYDAPSPDLIKRLVGEAAYLCSKWQPNADDADEWNALNATIEELDTRASPGVAVGRPLQFPVAGGEATYLIDRVKTGWVHCVWIANIDERRADAVDDDGWCLHLVAERQIIQRDERVRPP